MVEKFSRRKRLRCKAICFVRAFRSSPRRGGQTRGQGGEPHNADARGTRRDRRPRLSVFGKYHLTPRQRTASPRHRVKSGKPPRGWEGAVKRLCPMGKAESFCAVGRGGRRAGGGGRSQKQKARCAARTSLLVNAHRRSKRYPRCRSAPGGSRAAPPYPRRIP